MAPAFTRTYLERDVPQLGIHVGADSLRRLWTMLGHDHGQTWNGCELARAFGVTDKTVRHDLDVLVSTFMVRGLAPWQENFGKRQVKAPKVYLSDTGLLHALLGLVDEADLLGHPKVGASFEGFAISGPVLTPSMRSALENLRLDQLEVIHVGGRNFPLSAGIRAVAMSRLHLDVAPLGS